MADLGAPLPDLLALLESLVPADGRSRVVIFGSAGIVLHGVELGRPVGDLDVFASPSTMAHLARETGIEIGSKPASEGGTIPHLVPAENIEILQSFPGVEFSEVLASSRPTSNSRGLLVGRLDHLRRWKLAQGREKDLLDVEAIDRFLAER